ncbi:MAG: hypothetical protein MUF85_01685 [Patescibacteria group bacterium]|jgi:ABC-2 type transport system permease protein|nr:hypothetical protein [Patescibacteria group bacterium]
MKTIRLGNKIVRTLVRDRIYYPDRLIVDTFGIIARCGVLLLLYWYVFEINNGSINNTTFNIAAWSMFLYFSFSVFRLRDISRAIMQDVQSGSVEVLFSKPVSYLTYRMWWQVGAGLYPFLIISLFGSIIMALIVGIPDTMLISIYIPTLIAVIIFGSFLSLFLYAFVGLISFWVEDINPIFWIVDKAVMILGGSYLPVALFPDLMYKVAVLSPFGASQFITHTVYQTWSTEWFFKLGVQIFWILVFAIMLAILFSKAKRKVSVNGG